MSEFLKQALERLKKESGAVKGAKEGAMKQAVREALEDFARQDEEFAQAIAQEKEQSFQAEHSGICTRARDGWICSLGWLSWKCRSTARRVL